MGGNAPDGVGGGKPNGVGSDKPEGEGGDKPKGRRGLPVRTLVESSSIAAAALYAYGWVIASLFYGTFDVAPEEVGIGFAYVTIRVFFVIAAVVAVVGIVWGALQRIGRKERWLHLSESTTSSIVKNMFGGAGAFALAILGDRRLLVERLLPTLVLIVAFWTVLGLRKEGPVRVNLSAVIRGVAWVVAAVTVVVVVVVTPAEVADELADDVQAGREVDLRPMLGITLVQVDRVHAEVAGMALAPCVALLGTAGGTVVLYDSDARKVLRVPQEQVRLSSPC